MTTPAARGGAAPPSRAGGLLRSLVLFHEPMLLGAGTSVLNVVEPLREYGWSVLGWVPGEGLLREAADERLEAVACADRPLAVSRRAGANLRARSSDFAGLPAYLAAVRDALLELRPHVVHANTLRSLPEALVARRLGLPVVFHVHELPPPNVKRRRDDPPCRPVGRRHDRRVRCREPDAAVARAANARRDRTQWRRSGETSATGSRARSRSARSAPSAA